jgi:predicted dehydrogenase
MECVVAGRPIPVHVHQDYVQRPPARACKIIGDRGTIVADFVRPSVDVSAAGDRPAETLSFPGFERNQMFVDEMRHFLDCVRGLTSPVVPLREGALSLRIALAARESMETGHVVDLT